MTSLFRKIFPILCAGLFFGGPSGVLRGQSHNIFRAGEGLQETGSPLFSVVSKETLGLDSPPTDLHVLPDGRILAVSGTQLAFGDGVRWNVFNQATNEPVTRALNVAVDEKGVIYQAIQGGFARVELGDDGLWRLIKVADWPAEESPDRPVPRNVITVGAQWFWHSNSGPITSWRPGQPAISMGSADTVAHILKLHDDYYLCDWSNGAVALLPRPGESTTNPRQLALTGGFVTSSQPLNDDLALVGTTLKGLQVFDGRILRPFPAQGVLSEGQRINSICRTEGRFFAAAVENHGVIFFDEDGHTLQSLDRTLDHRLGRVLQLATGQNGIVWGLLTDGIFRVEFPSRVSHFEPIFNTGLSTIHPTRSEGRLWLMADNRLLRANYETDGRISGFTLDTPPYQGTYALSCELGMPIAGAEKGGYYRDSSGWVLFAPGSRYLRIPQNKPIDGQWLYCAENEIGWVRRTESGLEVTRYPTPNVGRVFNSNTDGNGDVWLEFGTGLIGRIRPGRPGAGDPQFEVFDAKQGVPEGWAQIFVVDGIVRFNIADRILRLNEAGTRLVPDEEFSKAFAGLGTIVGRPGRDALGRLWVTTEQGIYLFEGSLNHLKPVPEPMPAGFQPYYFTFETEGVVWMHSSRRFARYDPSIPAPRHEPLRALITHVSLPSSSRTLYPAANSLPALSFADNTVVPHFLSTGNILSNSVTFDVKLEGSGQDWVSAGSAGSTIFNQLHEGNYLLSVRPRTGSHVGEITTLAFTILPPWYRTITAYVTGAIGTIGLIFIFGWLFTYLERREKYRLEQLVARRTGELKETNVRLASQVQEIRTLSQAIQQSPVGVLIIKLDGTIVFANPRLCGFSGYTSEELIGQSFHLLRETAAEDRANATEFDQAVVRGEPWHGQLTNRSKDGRVFHVRTTASPLRTNEGEIRHYLLLVEDITESLAEQDRRRRLEGQLVLAQKRESLGTLAGGIAHDFNNILTGILGYNELIQLVLGENSPVTQELAGIRSAGQRAKELVSQILSFSRQSNTQLKPLDLAVPVAEALKLIRASTPSSIEILQSLQPGNVLADSTQIHQIVLNLCTNAAHAMRDHTGRLEVKLDRITLDLVQASESSGTTAGDYMRLKVTDNGCGMSQAVLDRIFDPFFTTKDPGQGTGLGLSIVQSIVTGHRGGLRVRSQPGEGTTVELFFPISKQVKRDTAAPFPVPAGQKQEILIVDDEPMVSEFVAARLRQLGYLPTALLDPRAALEAYTAEPLRYSALVTDLTMPHMTGVELIRRLHERGFHPPTLIITGYNRNAARADLDSLPGILVLQKPFSGDELAQALHQVLQGATKPGQSRPTA